MGAFVTECDTGRPWASPRTYAAARKGECQGLELYCHYWQALVSKQSSSDLRPIPDWKTDSWWKFDPFKVSLDNQLSDLNRIQLKIRTGSAMNDTIDGWFVPDDPYRLPSEVTCLVLHTEHIRNSTTGGRGVGYYILVVEESVTPGTYERLGIGVAVAAKDQLSHGLVGRKSPSSAVILI